MRTHLLFILFFLGISNVSYAQILDRLGKRVENKVKQRVDRKIDKAVDKGLDKIEGKIENSTNNNKNSPQTSTSTNTTISSNYDFIPGDEVLFFDDFTNTNSGDFPSRWNTNGSGQVVNIAALNGNWLLIPDNTLSFPELKNQLPTNFTIEFDLFYPSNTTRPPVTFGFTEVVNPAKQSIKGKKIFYFRIPPKGAGLENIGYTTSLYSGRETTTEWPANESAGKIKHVSIAVNGQRIRLYVDTEKLFDLPKVFDLSVYRNNFHFRSAELLPKPKDGFYISNLRIANVSKDLNSQLIKDGKLITSGIHFDSGSDKIKPVSYNLLNEIGKLLQQNPSGKYDIVGHTDSDGSEELNQKLSQQRAESVRNYLIKNFNISPNNLQASGKGAIVPIANNSSPEGKAQNRRVEFIKK